MVIPTNRDEQPSREEQRLVKALVKAHHNALDHFRKGAAAAREAGRNLNALMQLKGFKTRDEVWKYVLQSSDLTEETFSYRTCASYMKTDADWEWMEALLGDELYSMTQNSFLAEAAKLNAKSRRKQESTTPTTDGEGQEAATGDDTDKPQAGSKPKDERGDTSKPTGGGSGDSSTGERPLDPVIVLTNLINSLNEIVESELKEEELPEIEALVKKALKLIEALKKRCSKK